MVQCLTNLIRDLRAHNYVMFYVEVDDIAEKSDSIVASGGQIVVPETQVPGSGSFAWCKDPSGNLFGLWKAAD